MVNYKQRVKALFDGAHFDHALVSSSESLRYFSGFAGIGGAYLFLRSDGTSRMFVTELEAPDAKEASFDELVVIPKNKKFQEEVFKAVADEIGRGPLGIEDSYVTLSAYER